MDVIVISAASGENMKTLAALFVMALICGQEKQVEHKPGAQS
jgi:hypothetical protein